MVVTLDGVVPNGWKSFECTFLDIVRSILSFLSVNMSGSLVTLMESSSGSTALGITFAHPDAPFSSSLPNPSTVSSSSSAVSQVSLC